MTDNVINFPTPDERIWDGQDYEAPMWEDVPQRTLTIEVVPVPAPSGNVLSGLVILASWLIIGVCVGMAVAM